MVAKGRGRTVNHQYSNGMDVFEEAMDIWVVGFKQKKWGDEWKRDNLV